MMKNSNEILPTSLYEGQAGKEPGKKKDKEKGNHKQLNG